MHRKVDVNTAWIAALRGRIEWAMLPVVSPGKTMLLLSPTKLLNRTSPDALAELSETICMDYAQRDVDLAQLLLDPNEPAVMDAYANAGFSPLAELVYLHRAIKPAMANDTVALTGTQRLVSYSPQLEELFADAIRATYHESLDCPGLNGIRRMQDVIDGHRATGEFVPDLWHILLEHDRPVAVLLLNRSIHSEAMELVYIGLALEARGRGIGDLLMRIALMRSAQDAKQELTLAVDSRNTPAMKLYFRHGLKRVGSRSAMIRDLRALRWPITPAGQTSDR
jgi:ribosomal protein S18 acetylase RimI-like enzyme